MTLPNTPPWRRRAIVTLHTLLAIVGGWGVIALAVPLAAVAFTAAGLPRSEGTVLAMMLGFIAYLVLLLWSFSVRLPRLLAGLTSAASLAAVLLYLLT